MTSIQEMPNELILMVVGEVSLATFAALRQTCRRFNQVTILTFGRRYFHTRNIMLHEKSVQSLVSIADHSVLASCVRKVGFTPMVVTRDWLGFDEECKARQSYEKKEMTFQNMQDIPQRLPSTFFMLALEKAFERLPNCNTISVTNNQRPWGRGKLTFHENRDVRNYYENPEAEAQVFIRYLIGYLFSLSVKYGIENVEIFADKVCHKPVVWRHCNCKSVGIYDVCMAQPAAVSKLKSLKMTLNAGPKAWPNDAFAQLLSCFPQLSSLTLDFDKGTGESLYFSKFKIPRLKELTLSCKFCHPSELVDIIKQHEETLERVALYDVQLKNLPEWLLLMDVFCQMSGIHVYIGWPMVTPLIYRKGLLRQLYRELYEISELKDDNDKRKVRDLLHQINDWSTTVRNA
ncbi:uncharacterized protein FFB20_10963 [Fusarium fujikuroi]|uniref:F-box domain-containing protein n=1 Tax=Fusarium fujikuroi TaxID=5127 RepID=A0A0J0A299_FUSFU|nr:uncharacterized protein Y057_6247 [Fusarium fujikuroi]KLO94886.1 uncharacterized protein LW93_3575 [Fusarium fujikuroi]KLP14230.1 uncharacterized protein LW94_13975 [Fusarium fujikuroi]QGI69913.1 hypothetical protein CEK27_002242 [Fusarium fujikuroi]SCN99572.1 uncharacterized protein FFB20_10963 [Fusarium fujikuroi]